MVCALKFLAPEALASAVIGSKGTVIAEMRRNTQARIALTDHHDLYPGTDCRVLTAQANSEESLAEVFTTIIAKLADCVQANPSEALGQPGDLKLRTLAPRAAVGGLIGKGGAQIKQLRETSQAKITISEATGTGPSAEQTVAIVGTKEALEQVMAQVNHHVQALNKEGWFQGWATAPGTVSGAAARNGYSSLNTNQQVAMSGGYGPGVQAGPSVGYGSMTGGIGANAMGPPGVDLMVRVAQSLPPHVMGDARGFALSCVVPNRLVGGLIGRGGHGTKEVQAMTGTKIGIREIPNDPDNRSMNIAGPLASTCAAYMLMMRRYLDAEAQAAVPPPQQPGEGRLGGAGGGGGRRGAAAAAAATDG